MISWKPCISFIFEAMASPSPAKKMAIRTMKTNPKTKAARLGNPEPEHIGQAKHDQALDQGYGCSSKGFSKHNFGSGDRSYKGFFKKPNCLSQITSSPKRQQ